MNCPFCNALIDTQAHNICGRRIVCVKDARRSSLIRIFGFDISPKYRIVNHYASLTSKIHIIGDEDVCVSLNKILDFNTSEGYADRLFMLL